jgi:predicted DNA-binding transcriptional regulator AlpA
MRSESEFGSAGSHPGPVVNLASEVADVSKRQRVAAIQPNTVVVTPEFGMQLLSVEQVAQIFGVSPAWVRDHATRKQPHLKRVKVGKLLKFRPNDIEEFINEWCQ